ncbi:hypothetical protein F5X68DRAFT_31986 [Plectosphaerella plurivora]|uniref:Uncharacterized protein n=1 Tax=Plectosphaerella plurivora TaxID=936078 RepID=A0A9P9AHS6_9PEZI|nr:hypothetical protein F5X68DRAFT_31986 [Plectosphaerella plurivora]
MAPGSSNQQTVCRPQHGAAATSDTWVTVTEIDDDDLQFGGKSLCEWYEEDRRRLSNGSEDEAPRGRQRARTRHSSDDEGRKKF